VVDRHVGLDCGVVTLGKSPTVSGAHLSLTTQGEGGSSELPATLRSLVIAGWTGRDRNALEAHITELAKLGVPRPTSTPIFYRVASSLLTTDCEIQVAGSDTSGEVEPVLFSLKGNLWLGVGSDHTDRKVETVSITLAKQICSKPIADTVWRFDDVSGHWDELIVRSFATVRGNRRLYQEGPLAKMRHPNDLMSLYLDRHECLPDGTAMFCGTLAVLGKIMPADAYELELEDPVLHRKINHHYAVTSLRVLG
jgi:hypothetical protein